MMSFSGNWFYVWALQLYLYMDLKKIQRNQHAGNGKLSFIHIFVYIYHISFIAQIYIYNINICKLEQIEYSSFWTTFLFQWAIVRFDVAQFPVVWFKVQMVCIFLKKNNIVDETSNPHKPCWFQRNFVNSWTRIFSKSSLSDVLSLDCRKIIRRCMVYKHCFFWVWMTTIIWPGHPDRMRHGITSKLTELHHLLASKLFISGL